MALSALVERALSLQRSGSGWLCNQAQGQTIIPQFAASATQTVEISPPVSSYAAVAYEFSLNDTQPWAWSISLHAYGLPALSMEAPTAPILPMWIPLTERNVLELVVTNRDSLVRSFACTISYLIVATVDDWKELMLRLQDAATVDDHGNRLCIGATNRLCIGGR